MEPHIPNKGNRSKRRRSVVLLVVLAWGIAIAQFTGIPFGSSRHGVAPPRSTNFKFDRLINADAAWRGSDRITLCALFGGPIAVADIDLSSGLLAPRQGLKAGLQSISGVGIGSLSPDGEHVVVKTRTHWWLVGDLGVIAKWPDLSKRYTYIYWLDEGATVGTFELELNGGDTSYFLAENRASDGMRVRRSEMPEALLRKIIRQNQGEIHGNEVVLTRSIGTEPAFIVHKVPVGTTSSPHNVEDKSLFVGNHHIRVENKTVSASPSKWDNWKRYFLSRIGVRQPQTIMNRLTIQVRELASGQVSTPVENHTWEDLFWHHYFGPNPVASRDGKRVAIFGGNWVTVYQLAR